MAGTMAAAEVVFSADISDFRRGINEVHSSIGNLASLGGGIQNLGSMMMLGITAPIVAGLTAATRVAAEFDAEMRNVSSISTRVAGDFQGFSDRVAAFGATTVGGATEAAKAFYQVFSAGVVDAEAAFEVMRQGTYLSEAGLTDVSETTLSLITSLQAYGYRSSQEIAAHAAAFSDVWAQTVQLGVGSLTQFQTVVGGTVQLASALGVVFQENAASAAYLSTTGMRLGSVTAGLRGIFSKMIAPTEAMSALYDRLGVSSGQDLIETFGGLEGALGAIRGEIGTNSEEWHKLFNTIQSFNAVTAIMNNFEDYGAFLTQFGDGLEGATGRARAEQLKSFSASLQLAASALQSVGIVIGNAVMPFLTPLIQKFTQLMLEVSKLDPVLIQMGVVFAVVAAAIPPLVFLFGTFITPMGLIVSAVVALSAAFGSEFNSIITDGSSFLSELDPLFNQAADIVRGFYDTLAGNSAVQTRAFNIPTGVDDMGNELADYSYDRSAQTPGLSFGNRFAAAIDDAKPLVLQFFTNVRDYIVNTAIPRALTAFDNLGASVINKISEVFSGSQMSMEGGSAGGSTALGLALTNLFDGGAENAVNSFGVSITERFPAITAALSTVFGQFGEWLKNEGLPTIAFGLGALGGAIAGLFAKIFSGVLSVVGGDSTQTQTFGNILVESFLDGFFSALEGFDINTGTERVGAVFALIVGGAMVTGVAKTALSFGMTTLLGSVFGSGSTLLTVGVSAVSGLLSSIFALVAAVPAVAAAAGLGMQMLLTNGFVSAFTFLERILPARAGAFLYNIFSGIVTMSSLAAGLLTAIAGAITGYLIYSALPEETKQAVASWLATELFGFGSYDEFADTLQVGIADGIAKISTMFGRPDIAAAMNENIVDPYYAAVAARLADADLQPLTDAFSLTLQQAMDGTEAPTFSPDALNNTSPLSFPTALPFTLLNGQRPKTMIDNERPGLKDSLAAMTGDYTKGMTDSNAALTTGALGIKTVFSSITLSLTQFAISTTLTVPVIITAFSLLQVGLSAVLNQIAMDFDMMASRVNSAMTTLASGQAVMGNVGNISMPSGNTGGGGRGGSNGIINNFYTNDTTRIAAELGRQNVRGVTRTSL